MLKTPRENRCFQTVIVFSFGSVDNLNKCTVLWKMAAKLIAVSTSVNNKMWVKLNRAREGVGIPQVEILAALDYRCLPLSLFLDSHKRDKTIKGRKARIE